MNQAWVNFKRNSALSLSAVGVMAIALILLVGLVGLGLLTSQVTKSLQEKVDVTAYFSTDAQEDQILSIKSDLQELPEVKSVDYISRDEALALFKERHKDDALIQESLEELDTNPLQASLNIKANNPDQYPVIVKGLENHRLARIIDKVNFYERQGVIDKINSISNALQTWGAIATLLLAFLAVVVTFNTIRLTIYSQRREIEIMKLVGASNWQVRGPYLVEGGYYGVLATIVSLLIVYPTLYLVSDKVSGFASNEVNIFNYFSHFSFEIILLVLFTGILLGVGSSYFAVHRHLKI